MSTQAVPFKAFSLEPDAFTQGGLLNDEDIEVVDAQWVPFNYGGKATNVTEDKLALRMMCLVLGEDGKAKVGPDGQPMEAQEQHWTAGPNFDEVLVNPNNTRMCGPREGGPSTLHTNSNAHALIKSLYDNGLPKGTLEDGDMGHLIGLRFHILRKAFKRDIPQGGRAQRDRPDETPVCVKMIWGPWMGPNPKAAKGGTRVNGPVAASAATTAAASAAPAAVAAPAASPEMEAAAERLVREVMTGDMTNTAIKEVNGSRTIAKLTDLKVLVFRKATADKTIPADQRNVVGNFAASKQWLEDKGLMLESDGMYVLV